MLGSPAGNPGATNFFDDNRILGNRADIEVHADFSQAESILSLKTFRVAHGQPTKSALAEAIETSTLSSCTSTCVILDPTFSTAVLISESREEYT